MVFISAINGTSILNLMDEEPLYAVVGSWIPGVAPVRPDTRLVEVMQCTLAVSDSPARNAGCRSIRESPVRASRPSGKPRLSRRVTDLTRSSHRDCAAETKLGVRFKAGPIGPTPVAIRSAQGLQHDTCLIWRKGKSRFLQSSILYPVQRIEAALPKRVSCLRRSAEAGAFGFV